MFIESPINKGVMISELPPPLPLTSMRNESTSFSRVNERVCAANAGKGRVGISRQALYRK